MVLAEKYIKGFEYLIKKASLEKGLFESYG